MKLKDVRLRAVPNRLGSIHIVYIKEENSGKLIGRFWPIFGLNKRQTLILVRKMCNTFNAEQTYGPLEKKIRKEKRG